MYNNTISQTPSHAKEATGLHIPSHSRAPGPTTVCTWHKATCNVYLSDRAAQGRQSVDLKGKEKKEN